MLETPDGLVHVCILHPHYFHERLNVYIMNVAAVSPGQFSMAKILLIEDDEDLATMVVEWLSFEHYSVELIVDGREGLDRLRLCQYDAVVLDWGLPQMNGPDICKTYRSEGGTHTDHNVDGKRHGI